MPCRSLQSWKEIAAYVRRGVRTVQRWEEFGLPVHRPAGHERSSVYALEHEVDAWMHVSGRMHTSNGFDTSQLSPEKLFLRLQQLETECGRIRQILAAPAEKKFSGIPSIDPPLEFRANGKPQLMSSPARSR